MNEEQTEIEELIDYAAAIRMPRPNHIGEEVFYRAWVALMSKPTDETLYGDKVTPLDAILGSYPYAAGQREATVCATFVSWLGNNNGLALRHEGQRFREAKVGMSFRAMLHAWTENNLRRRGLNGGIRTIEAMLAPDHDYKTFFDGGYFRRCQLRLPELAARDYETIEHLCLWLESHEGRAFVGRCEATIRELDGERRRRAQEEHEAQMRNLGLRPVT